VRSRAQRSGSGRAAPYQPGRGHLVYLDFTPHAGSEQGGRRPALVLSPLEYNVATGRVFACPITNQVKGSPFEVAISRGAGITGVILADQMRNLDWLARNAEFHSIADTTTVMEVFARIEAILRMSLDP
jgi:mRNA interferase MazF